MRIVLRTKGLQIESKQTDSVENDRLRLKQWL